MTPKEIAEKLKNINTRSLSNIAFFLEGFKLAKGNIYPLGTFDLEQLWEVIKLLNKK